MREERGEERGSERGGKSEEKIKLAEEQMKSTNRKINLHYKSDSIQSKMMYQ
jgi:hypothetical protein